MKRIIPTLLAFSQLVWAGDPKEVVSAGIDDHAKAAYFVLASSGYVFALNVVENGDVYFHMNAPASHSWMGIGFGSSMKDTRMIVSYIGEDGHTLINSPRISSGHSEPEWEQDIVIDPVRTDKYAPFSNTLSPDGIMISHAVCRNCSSWATGSINTTSKTQPFIFALGPNTTLHSDDLNAPLRLHDFHGAFQLDMTVATNMSGWYGRVPAPQDPGLQVGDSYWAFANYFSSNAYSTGSDAEWAQIVHAVFMCLAFLLVLPLGAITLRLVRRAPVHAAIQILGLGFVLIGLALGVYASKLYNKSKSFNSAHQVIGLVVFAAILLQIGLGLSHHIIFLRSGSPTVLGKVHRFLGISILVLGIVNGGIGLNWAGSSVVGYGIAVAIMTIIFGAISATIYFYNRQHIYKPENQPIAPKDSEAGGPADEYEMHQAPFATMGSTGYVQTPRTPFFGTTVKTANWDDDPDDYRTYVQRGGDRGDGGDGKGGRRLERKESIMTETPASDRENPFKAKWEAIPFR